MVGLDKNYYDELQLAIHLGGKKYESLSCGLKQHPCSLDPSVHDNLHLRWPCPLKLRKAKTKVAVCDAVAVMATAAISRKLHPLRIEKTTHSLEDPRSASRKAS